MFLTDSKEDAEKVRKWSTQSREAAPWYQHEEIDYNYRMSNIIAGIIRGQIPYLEVHMDQKRAIWERYEKGLADLPVKMNPSVIAHLFCFQGFGDVFFILEAEQVGFFCRL